MLNKPPLPLSPKACVWAICRRFVPSWTKSWKASDRRNPTTGVGYRSDRNQLLRRFEKASKFQCISASVALRLSPTAFVSLDKVLATSPSGTFRERTFMSSSRLGVRLRWLPYLLVAPQLVITVIFFIWPAGEVLWYSLQSVDPLVFPANLSGWNLSRFFTTVIISTPSGRRLNSARWSTFEAACWSRCFRRPVDYVVRGSRFIRR